jgi:hypothetical protein
VGNHGLMDKVETIALLLATGRDGSENAFHEGTAVSGMSAMGQATPNDGMARGVFGGIVGGFYARVGGKNPQSGFYGQQVSSFSQALTATLYLSPHLSDKPNNASSDSRRVVAKNTTDE